MGKNKKNRRNNKQKANQAEKKQSQTQDAGTDPNDLTEAQQMELAAEMMGLSEEQKQQIRDAPQNPPPAEEEFESTEEKARQDMEQCEKLIGIQGSTDKTYEERKQEVEEAKEKYMAELKDREHEELKRINKKNKKMQKEADLIFYDKRTSDDKKLKSLYDMVQRAAKEQIAIRETKFDQARRLEMIDEEIEKKNRGIDNVIKLKHTLYSVFQGLKDKNIEAYRLKDEAIKEQQQAKKDMTKRFEKEIDAVTASYQEQISIKEKYELKKKELEELAKVRGVIDQKEKKINDLQMHINEVIESELKTLMDKFNAEKAKYDKLTNERETMNEQYKALKDKFHKYLEEIESSDAKIKVYNEEVQTLQKKITDVLDENKKLNDKKDEILLQMSAKDEQA